MFINQKEVKKYVKGAGKQIAKDALFAVNDSVVIILDRAIQTARQFKRITKTEVLLALSIQKGERK